MAASQSSGSCQFVVEVAASEDRIEGGQEHHLFQELKHSRYPESKHSRVCVNPTSVNLG